MKVGAMFACTLPPGVIALPKGFRPARPGDSFTGPDGVELVVVPRVATEAMKWAGGDAQSKSIGSYGEPDVVWRAMIAAVGVSDGPV